MSTQVFHTRACVERHPSEHVVLTRHRRHPPGARHLGRVQLVIVRREIGDGRVELRALQLEMLGLMTGSGAQGTGVRRIMT